MAKDGGKKISWPKLNFNKRKLSKQLKKVEGATLRHTHKFIIKRWVNVREAQRHIVTWILIMGILIAATGLQLMWFRQGYYTTAGATDGVYAEAVQGPINTLNPLFASSSAEQSASYLMFSRLINYDKTGHLSYDLATNITVDKTETIYTIKIRNDVNWQDGQNLTANDIAFTIGLIKDPNVRTTIEGWNDIVVKVIDNYTIEFSLKSVYAAFEHALTFPILPKHLLGDIASGSIRENNFSNNPVGSGPFKFSFIQETDKTLGRRIVYMIRNESYYRGVAKISRFQLNTYNNTDEIRHAILIGEVNAAADLSTADITDLNENRYDIESNPINSGVYAIFNVKSPVLQDISLRRVLQLATNTDAVRADLPTTTPALDLPFTNSQLFGDLPKVSKYDLVTAKKTLDDTGWVLNAQNIREKAGVQLKLSVVTIKNNELEHALEVLISQWRALGIVIDTKVVDPNDASQGVVQNILQPRDYDILLYQLNIGGDPDVYAYWHSSQASPQGSNFANYSNVISDEALSTARVKSDPNLRNAKYITFAKQWLSDVPAIGLYQSTAQYVSNKNVHSVGDNNILISPIDRYSDILDWYAGTKIVYKTP